MQTLLEFELVSREERMNAWGGAIECIAEHVALAMASSLHYHAMPILNGRAKRCDFASTHQEFCGIVATQRHKCRA